MNQDTRQAIITVLTAFLNRPPSEAEIQNCQTDVLMMNKVNEILNPK